MVTVMMNFVCVCACAQVCVETVLPVLWEGSQNHKQVLYNPEEWVSKWITLHFIFLHWWFSFLDIPISMLTSWNCLIVTCGLIWPVLASESQSKSPLWWTLSASWCPTPAVSVWRRWAVTKTSCKNWHACSYLEGKKKKKQKRNLNKHSHLTKGFSCLKEAFVFQSETSTNAFCLRVI